MSRPSVASCPERVALPVIFVPGIMGSRLRNEDGDLVWLPENMFAQLWDKAGKNALEKRLELIGEETGNFDPNYLEVHPGKIGGLFTEHRISASQCCKRNTI